MVVNMDNVVHSFLTCTHVHADVMKIKTIMTMISTILETLPRAIDDSMDLMEIDFS